MPDLLADRFIRALTALEQENDLQDLVALYAPEAKVGNMLSPDELVGPAGARSFWSTYRRMFGTVRSRFHTVIVGDRGAALEWISEGTTPGGNPVHYAGVTILEWNDGLLTRSMAYFDSATLGHQLGRLLGKGATAAVEAERDEPAQGEIPTP